jgi:glycosyltransferase involved in cell wall biosynthesis
MKRENGMTIGYVVFDEDLSSPLIQSQVIDVITEIKRQAGERFSIVLIWFCPIKIYFRRSQVRHFRQYLDSQHIRLVVVPILYLGRWFAARLVQIPLIYQTTVAILILSRRLGIKLFHVRSYPGTLPFCLLKRFTRDIRFIVDTRSDFVKENTLKSWKNAPLTRRYWTKKEKEIYQMADGIVAISEQFYLDKLRGFHAKSYVIPNNVRLMNVDGNTPSYRKILRNQMGIAQDSVVFSYSGSLGNGWNKIETYAALVRNLATLPFSYHILILSPQYKEVSGVFDRFGIERTLYTAISVEHSELPKYLSIADFGLQLMMHVDTRIGVKVVEYLSVGLPVIVNRNVLGAAEFVKRHRVGIVIDGTAVDGSAVSEILSNYGAISRRCRQVASDNFSTENIAKKYVLMYTSMFNKRPWLP